MCLFLFNSNLNADTGAYDTFGGGGTLIPIKNYSILMQEEVINITVSPATNVSNGNDDFENLIVEYECIFIFKNETSEFQSVLMGFPSENKISNDSEGNYNKGPCLDNFTSIINGREVKVNISNDYDSLEIPGLSSYGSVFSFNADFKPNEELVVKNTFSIMRGISIWKSPEKSSHPAHCLLINGGF